MMTYYLLRENQESGPYTFKELKAMTLLSTDLIWVNGESTSWKYPTEIDDLKACVKEAKPTEKMIFKNTSSPTKKENVSTQIQATTEVSKSTITSTVSQWDYLGIDETTPSFEELKRKYAEKAPKKIVWRRHANIGASLMGIATLVIGVMLAAFMIKKAVDNIEFEPMVATANAHEIETLPASTTNHSALGIVTKPTHETSKVPDSTKAFKSMQDKSALKKRDILIPTVPNSKEKEDVRAVPGNDEMLNAAEVNEELAKENQSNGALANDGDAVSENGDEKKKVKPTLQVSANEYKVGLLGGISDLELSITNPSSQTIQKAVLEVEYLKPNGKVTNSQMVEVSDVAPGSSKKIPIPNNSRGVSVRYKVVNIES